LTPSPPGNQPSLRLRPRERSVFRRECSETWKLALLHLCSWVKRGPLLFVLDGRAVAFHLPWTHGRLCFYLTARALTR
jgi:hypothetical protein